MLEIRQLKVEVEGKAVLRGLDLTLGKGEVHAIMGPNGSGKSTLAHVLSGREGYTVTAGEIRFGGQDLLALSPAERAQAGLFLGFQYPVEIPGVSNLQFLKSALNAQRVARGEQALDAAAFMRLARERAQWVQLDAAYLKRAVNVGFSGGEKKRNEIFQMAMLTPKLAVLDEIDSGLDIDALKIVAAGVNRLRSPERSVVLITHYQRLLDHIRPDHIHVLVSGQVVRSGGPELAHALEAEGYAYLDASAEQAAMQGGAATQVQA